MIGINRAEDAVDGIVEADAAWQRQSGFEHVVPTATTADDVWEALPAVEPSACVGQPNVERVVVLGAANARVVDDWQFGFQFALWLWNVERIPTFKKT